MARTYDFIDGEVTASFEHPGAVSPEDAEAVLTAAIEAIGGQVTQGFSPGEQDACGDPGYIGAHMRLELPDGRRVWVLVECPTDAAFD